MRIAKVYGNLTLNRSIPQFQGAAFKLVCPLDQDNLRRAVESSEEGLEWEETLAAWDLIGVGNGSLVALSEGPEAAMPFRPDIKPVDAAIAALLDRVELEPEHDTT